MDRLRVSIHPLFLAFGILCIFFDFAQLFFSYLVSIILHELGHAYIAKKLGYKLKNMSFLPFGAELNISQKFFKNHEILIAIAGPIVNILLILMGLTICWLFPISYFYLNDFVFTNFIIFIFNMLPIYPLDGGRILLGLLKRKIEVKKAEKFIYILSFSLSIFIFIIFVFTLFFSPNYTIGVISIFLTTSSLNFNKSAIYEKNYVVRDYEKLLKKGSEVKVLAVSKDMPIYKLPNYIDANHFCIFVVFNDNKKVYKIIFENNVEKILLNNDVTSKIGDIK